MANPNSNSDQFRQKLGNVMSDVANESKTFYILAGHVMEWNGK